MSHEISLAVWDVPSPFVIGRRATIKVGISCPSGCVLAGTTIEIRDQQGALLGSGVIGSEPWPGSIALYWVEIDVAAPDVEGARTWTVHGIPIDPAHDALNGSVRVIAAGPPEHRVTFEVIEQGSGIPLAGVELRVGPFRAATNDAGVGCVDVPRATYEIGTWKIGYNVAWKTVDVAADATIRLELIAVPEPEQPYWM